MAVAQKKKPIKRRESFFGQQVIRLMTKTCLANDIGPYAFTLLAIVSAQQDAAKGRQVTYWNDQLMSLVGIRKWESFAGVRQKCIDAGWLVYQNRGRRSAGLYEVVIPKQFAHLSDSRCDEGSPLYPPNGDTVYPNEGDTEYPPDGGNAGDKEGYKGGYKAGDKEGYKRGYTPSSPSTSPSTSNTPYPLSGFSQAFQMAWDLWPAERRTKRETAQSAWQDSVVRLAFRFEGDSRQAEAWLLSRVRQFVKSPKASGRFCPGIANWLIDGRYDDAPESWQDSGEDSAPQSTYGEIAPI
jgi:hypothetical protein